jgi:hypothetical protein
MGRSFILVDPRQHSHSHVRVQRDSRLDFTVSDSRPPKPGEAGPPYLNPPGAGWPSYTPRHWVPFSSPPTTHSDMVETFEPHSTRALTEKSKNQSQSNFTTGGLPPISLSWRQALENHDQKFSPQLNPCGNSPYVRSSLIIILTEH